MRFHKTVALGMLSVLALTACGETGNTDDATEPAAPPAENRVQIGMTEYAYSMPAKITGGTVTLEFTNQGELPHEVAFGPIAGDHDLDDVMKALESGEEPKWFSEDLAGIPILDPGGTTSMTRDLDPGRYAFFCGLPTPEGAPHLTEGMVKVFDAEGTSDAEGPQPDLTIAATDKGFEVPPIFAGTQTIELVNDGSKPHEFAILSFEPGKTEQDLGKWFGGGFKGEKPALFPGGLQSIDPGISVIVEMEFVSGRSYIVQDFENKLETEFEVK